MTSTHSNSESIARIQAAFSDALALLHDGIDFEFDGPPAVLLIDDDAFSASVYRYDRAVYVEVNRGCVEQIDGLWGAVFDERILLDGDGERLLNYEGDALNKFDLVHISLVWLCLHELVHVRLGHLDLLGVASLVEVEVPNESSRNKLVQYLAAHFEGTDLKLLRPCLELQADNDATELLFGGYDENNWDQFRIEAAAIFVVMALMERAEIALDINDDERVYPKVGTRFFTLFAQLFQYWLYGDARLEAGDGESFVRTAREPQGKDFERYVKTVLALTISDAIQIAASAEVMSFLDDIGAGQDFFEDIYKIQYADDMAQADLQTQAARQWRELLPINEAFMAITDLRG